MKIRSIHIYGYGKIENKQITISPTFQLFYGENEVGKTTIMAFLRHVLFGFPTKVHSERQYEPKQHTAYGGRIEIESDSYGVVAIERIGKTATGEVTVYFADGSTGGEEALTALLDGMNKELYEAIFSFGIDGLQQLGQLREAELGEYLLSASMAGTDVIRTVEKRLEKEQDALYKPNGKKPLINDGLQELKDVYAAYQKWQKQLKEYDSLNGQREEQENILDEIEKERSALQEEIKQIQRKQTIQPLLLEQKKYETIMLEYADSAHFPIGGIKQLDEVLTQLQSCRKQYDSLQKEDYLTVVKEQVQSLGIHEPQHIQLNDVVKEEGKEYGQQFQKLQSQKEQLDLAYAVSRDELEQSEQTVANLKEKVEKQPTNRLERFTSTNEQQKYQTFAMMLLAIGNIVMMLISLVSGGFSTFLAFLSLFLTCIVVYIGVKRQGQTAKPEESRFLSMLELEELKLRQVERGYEQIVKKYEEWERNMYELEGKIDTWKKKIGLRGNIPIGQLALFIEKIERVKSAYERLQQVKVEIRHCEKEIQSLQQICQQLFAAAGVKDEAAFRMKGEQNNQYEEAKKQVILQKGQLQSIAAEELLIATELYVDYGMILAEKEQLLRLQVEAERQAQGQLAKITAEIQQREEGTTYQDIIYQLEMKKAQVKELVKRWGSVTLARELVRKTKEMYREERLPAIFQLAERYFSYLTGEEYHRIFLPKENQIQVERNDGQRFLVTELSRGTAEQLYVAIRLALANTYKHVYPLVLDDPFVNFDKERTNRTMTLLAEISKKQQILLFTCHEHLISLKEEIDITYLRKDE